MSALDRAIASIREIDADFAELIQSMYERRFTGYIGLHWKNGIPSSCDLPGTCVRFRRPSKAEAVDNGTKVADAVRI